MDSTPSNQALILNDYDKLYLLMAKWKLMSHLFNPFCYVCNIQSIADLERQLYSNWREFPTDWLKSWQDSPSYTEDVSTIEKMVEESKSVNFEDLPELLGIKKNYYKEKLEEAGVHLIAKEKLSLQRKLALGRPYSGDVYQAKWTKSHGTELNVVLRYDLSSEQREMFLREASMLCNIKHDNIMTLYGAVVLGSYAGSLGLVVELFSKGNLEEFKVSSLFQAWLFSCQLSSALEYLEHRQVVHTSLMTPFTYVSSEEKIKIGGFMFCYSKEEIEKAKQSGSMEAMLDFTVIEHQGQRIDHLDVKGVVILFANIVKSMFRHLYLHLKSLKEFLRLIPFNNSGSWYPPWGISSLLERCVSTDFEARPSFNEIVNLLAKERPKKLCFTVDYSSTEANGLSYAKGEEIWVISEDPASYQGMWLGQKDDGKVGFFKHHNTVTANIEQQVPYEIRARGIEAELAYKEALLEGKMQVFRVRLLFIGQDRAGKTSLKKSLLGLPFDPNEPSTEGVEVNHSRFEVSVEQVVEWKAVSGRDEFAEEQLQKMQNKSIAKLVAEKLGRKNAETPAEETEERSLELEERGRGNAQVHEEDTLTNLVEDTNDQVSALDQPDGIRSAVNDTGPQPTQESEIHMPSTLHPLVVECLKNASQPKEENIETRETVLDIWDFAGQHLYYATHSVFFSQRAIYVLVYNLNRKLDDLAKPSYQQGAHQIRLSNLSGETNLQTLQSWMASVHSIRQPLPDLSRAESGLPYRPPPILMVGTHVDAITDPAELKQIEAQISSSISGKAYQEHVLRPFYAVNNRLSSQSPGVKEIQERVQKLMASSPFLNEDLPVKWFNFEKTVKKLAKEGTSYMHLEEIYNLARKDCFIYDEKQLEAMLNFYHDLGVILRFKDTVVTNTQWLIDLFGKLITIRPFKDQDPVDGSLWEELETIGILHPRLINRVFAGSVSDTTFQQSILDMMEMYGFVAKFCCHGQGGAPGQDVTLNGVKYFVPAQLTVSPENLWKLKPQDSDPCPLLFKFRDGFVPHGLFPQLVSRLISRCHELKCFEEPKLFCNGAQFGLGKRNQLDLIILCSKRYLKLVLRSYSDPLPNSDEDTDVLSAFLVRSLIEDELKALCQQWHWLGNANYNVHVLCMACGSTGRKECTHKSSSCSDPDCVHIIPISPREPRKLLTCSHQFGEGSKFVASGLDRWYIDSSVEEQRSPRTPSYASVDSVNLVDLAGDIPIGKLKRIGRLLGFEDPELERIESDKNDAYERCYEMLATWKQRQGKNETCESLERALCHKHVALNDLAQQYCFTK